VPKTQLARSQVVVEPAAAARVALMRRAPIALAVAARPSTSARGALGGSAHTVLSPAGGTRGCSARGEHDVASPVHKSTIRGTRQVSGTVTMELAAARAPAVVVYRANPVKELLARLLAAVR
jgi:hypothetical protein